MQTIPNAVLEKIATHRPHLQQIIDNLRNRPAQARQYERAIANAYCCGETHLTVQETYALSFCCVGEPYGGQVCVA